MSLKILLGDYL